MQLKDVRIGIPVKIVNEPTHGFIVGFIVKYAGVQQTEFDGKTFKDYCFIVDIGKEERTIPISFLSKVL
jgi:hypothetical protein